MLWIRRGFFWKRTALICYTIYSFLGKSLSDIWNPKLNVLCNYNNNNYNYVTYVPVKFRSSWARFSQERTPTSASHTPGRGFLPLKTSREIDACYPTMEYDTCRYLSKLTAFISKTCWQTPCVVTLLFKEQITGFL